MMLGHSHQYHYLVALVTTKQYVCSIRDTPEDKWRLLLTRSGLRMPAAHVGCR